MCGRFIFIPQDELTDIIASVQQNLASEKHPVSVPKDAFPESTVPIVLPGENDLLISAMHWGYPVSWQKGVVFNTRQDSASKKMWANSVEHRRCLVPSYGFYEPHKSETAISTRTGKPIKKQYLFNLPGISVLMMAGIYEDDHFSIMTTEPNQWVSPVHDRMPVVLRQNEWEQWLSPEYASLYDRSNVELVARPI